MAIETPELNHATVDIAAIISGVTYPEDTFPIWLDRAASYELVKLSRAMDTIADQDSDEFKAVAEKAQAMKNRLEASKFVVTVRGTSRRVRLAIVESLTSKHNLQPGQRLTTEQYEENQARMWAAHIVNIETPNGESFRPSIEQALELRGELSEYAIGQIDKCIDVLAEGEAAGFELAAMDVDFLSEPSHAE